MKIKFYFNLKKGINFVYKADLKISNLSRGLRHGVGLLVDFSNHIKFKIYKLMVWQVIRFNGCSLSELQS